jgi:group I intron endonuclease
MIMVVYQATNLINGKRYVGITAQLLSKRKAGHLTAARQGQPYRFYNAIRRHGEEFFRFTVLKTCETRAEACEIERRLIALWQPKYNTASGGEGNPGITHSPETRQKMRRRAVGRRPTDEAIAKAALINRGAGNIMNRDPDVKRRSAEKRRGAKRTEDQIARMSAARKGKALGNQNAASLTPEKVLEIRQRLAGGEDLGAIGLDYGVSRFAIYDIKAGRRWAAIR